MRNYAGHRLAPWLAHVMVSRQETARPLLTTGEVMQLPPDEELVLISGMAPVRARKLRHYQDRNFTARILPAPELARHRSGAAPDPLQNRYADAPPARQDDWSGLKRAADVRLDRAEPAGKSQDDGGLQQQRHPGLPERCPVVAEAPRQLELLDNDREDDDPAIDAEAMDRACGSLIRGHVLNQSGASRDLLPGF
jgi:type IV secretion system protein VirD4